MQFQRIIIALFALSMLSIHVSPAIASISMGLLFLISIIYYLHPGLIKNIAVKHGQESAENQAMQLDSVSQNSSRMNSIKSKSQLNRIILVSAILLIFMLALEWYHGCAPSGFKVFKNFMPLFLLPFLGWMFSGMDANRFRKELNWLRPALNIPLIWMVIASSLEYLSHHQFYSEMILESKPMPLFSRVYHIEFSLILAMQLLFTLFLYRKGMFRKDRSWMIYTELVLLFLGLHFLSARTGLLSFWVGVIFLFSGDIRSISKKWLIAGVIVFATLILSFSSIRNRMVNSWEDMSAVVKGEDLNHKSFGQRWESWKAGVYMIKNHPLLGVGPCNFNNKHQEAYQDIGSGLRVENRIGPHNQWIQWIAEYGGLIIGFIFVYLWLVFRVSQNTENQVLTRITDSVEKPLNWKLNDGRNNAHSELWFVFALLACLIVASMFESILERQAGMWMLIFAVVIKNIPKNELNF